MSDRKSCGPGPAVDDHQCGTDGAGAGTTPVADKPRPAPKHWLDYLTLILAFAAAIAASFNAWHQSRIASDTEQRQLRAYVSMAGIQVEAQGRDEHGELMWMVEAVWRNSGATPARDLRVHSDAGATYVRGPSVSMQLMQFLDLAPHNEAFVFGGGSVPTSRLQSALAKGIAVYRDAFGHDRVTMSCRTAVLFDKEILKDYKGGQTFMLNSRPCGVDSCADEDCKAFRDTIGDKAPASAYEP
jgi:hypothetical protein